MAAPPARVLPQADPVFKKNRSCFVLFCLGGNSLHGFGDV